MRLTRHACHDRCLLQGIPVTIHAYRKVYPSRTIPIARHTCHDSCLSQGIPITIHAYRKAYLSRSIPIARHAELLLGRRNNFFPARCTSLHIHSYLLILFLCFYVLFHSCCSDAQVFGKTLVNEFHILYIHAGWYLRSSLGETGDKIWKRSVVITKL